MTKMTLANRMVTEDVWSIDVAGAILSNNVDDLLEMFSDVYKRDFSLLIINFSKTTFIGSAGISALMTLVRVVNESKVKKKLCFADINKKVEVIFDILNLNKLVDIFKNEDEALQFVG